NLPKLITECVRQGLAGLESLAGIPATLGGAVVMNAGGKFGEIGATVHAVHGLLRDGVARSFTRRQMHFEYRRTLIGIDTPKGPAGAIADLIITQVDLRLRTGDPAVLRTRLKEVMDYKKNSQPLADNSAGCVFKNPTMSQDLPGIAVAGQ